MAGIILAQVRTPSHSGPTTGAWIQRNADNPISVMAGYFSTLLAEYIPAQGLIGGTCDYDAEVQRGSAQSQLKKEGVDIWRNTDGQTLKKEGIDI